MKQTFDRRTFIANGTCAVGAGILLGTSSQTTKAAPELKLKRLSDRFLQRLPKMMEIANVPGTAVAFLENGRMSWSAGFGVKNATTRENVDGATVWQVGSLSKPVFALGVMRLVDAGKIGLDRPLVEYVPGEMIKDDPRSRSITARHVLSHSSGLQNWRFQQGQNLQLSFAPGERWSYSGEGIYYLQRAVEQVTGQSLVQFTNESVLRPLGMTSSSFFWLPDFEKRIATAHNGDGRVAADYIVQNVPRLTKVADEWKKPVETWRHEDQEKAQAQVENRFPPFPTFFPANAAGTLIASIEDYAMFVGAILNPPSAKTLSINSYAEMLKPQMRISDAVSWGLGWGLQTEQTGTKFWHWGEGINYRTFVIGDRSSRNAVIVFTNARNGRKIWERIVSEATQADQPLLLWL